MNNTLQVNIYDNHFDYSDNQHRVSRNGQVTFTNQRQQPVYLSPADSRVCPFTEAWPQCIPAGQSVVRQLIQPLQADGRFRFNAHNIGQPQLQGLQSSYSPNGPKDDGEIIVQD